MREFQVSLSRNGHFVARTEWVPQGQTRLLYLMVDLVHAGYEVTLNERHTGPIIETAVIGDTKVSELAEYMGCA